MLMFGLRRRAFFAVLNANDGGGSGGGTGNDPGKKTGDENPNPNDDPTKGKESEKKEEPKTDPKDEKKFSQKDVDDLITKRLDREKKKTDTEKEEKEGNFQKLYEPLKTEHEQTVKERDELKTQNEEYSGLIEKHLQATIKDWPKEVTDLYPATASVKDRMAWVDKSAPLAKRLGTQKPPVAGQHGKQGEPGGTKTAAQAYNTRYAGPAQAAKK